MKLFNCVCIGIAVFLIVSAVHIPEARAQSNTENVKVAFVGDLGVSDATKRNLRLIKDEGAQLIVILGDFDYLDKPQEFFDMVYSETGGTIPVLVVIGNHDKKMWPGETGYRKLFQNKIQAFSDVSCVGSFGDKGYCDFKGVRILLSGAGLTGGSTGQHAGYVNEVFGSATNVWRVCSFHLAAEKLQAGGKLETPSGMGIYENCRAMGAILATAHEHSYQRTKTLTNIESQIVSTAWPEPNRLLLNAGNSFVFVSGLGGHSMRAQERCMPTTYPYGCKGEWANIYTTNQGSAFGTLFLTFGVNGDPREGSGYFKNINGQVIDTFSFRSEVGTVIAPPPPLQPPTNLAADCQISGENASIKFSWSGVENATKYAVRLNKQNTCINQSTGETVEWFCPEPNQDGKHGDQFLYVKQSDCTNGFCSVTTPIVADVRYPDWSVQALDTAGKPSPIGSRTDSPGFKCTTPPITPPPTVKPDDPPPPNLRGDFNSDGALNALDVNLLIPVLYTTSCSFDLTPDNPPTGSCFITIHDFNELIGLVR